MRTNITHEQKTYNMNNEHSDVEINTDINVAMEVKLGKVSLNHDTCICHGDCFRNLHLMS